MKNLAIFLHIVKSVLLQMVFVCLITRVNVVTSFKEKSIEVLHPNENTVWYTGSTSYAITWTQKTTTFRWDIELLDSEARNKILDISTSLSEYKEKEMSFSWLIPDSVSDGTYVIRVKDANNEKHFGDSQQFSIQTQGLDSVTSNSLIDSFSSSSTYNPSVFTSLNSTQHDEHLLPHEIKHRRHLEQEEKSFRSIDMKDYWPKASRCAIKCVHRPSKEDFIKDFAEPQIPVIVTGLTDEWAAMKNWNFEELGMHLTQGVQVDLMDIMTPYSRWNEVRKNLADSLRNPPKVYMNNFHEVYPELMKDIKIPEIFSNQDDYLEIVDPDIRPSRLSFQMEPKRSGYHWHVETINGSLWSALIYGYKRWGLYSPATFFPPGVVHNKYRVQDSQSSEPFTWWAYTQPHLHADRQPLECVQEPGEILYIPSGWWWSYINLNDSISFKHWMCNKFSLRSCLTELKEQSDSGHHNYYADVFIQLRQYLAQHHPEILTADDREFQSPVRGLGKTFADLQEETSQREYMEYFGKHALGSDYTLPEAHEDSKTQFMESPNEDEQQSEEEKEFENEEWKKQVNEARKKRNRNNHQIV